MTGNNLIFYFSATGNSRHVAQCLQMGNGGILVPMDTCLLEGQHKFSVDEACSVGFVFPVYFWGLPTIVADFIAALQLDGTPQYTYGVATYGTSMGEVRHQLRKALGLKGMALDGLFGVRMVDVWTPMFDVSDHDKCLKRTQKAEAQIDKVALQIEHHEVGSRHWTELPHLLAQLEYRLYPKARQTRHFSVMDDRCTGCGLCARKCPTKAIAMDCHKRPFWQKSECAACLRCLHHCPHFAIQYGKHTATHGQFVHPSEIYNA